MSRPQGMLAFLASTTPLPPVPSMAVWLVSQLGRPLAADQARVGLEPYVIGQGGHDLTSRPGRSLQQTPTSGLVSPT